MSKYTKNDVLKFLYGEMSPAEQDGFLDALCQDEELFAAFEAMKKAQEDLEPVNMEPSEGAVNRVMGYARRAAKDSRGRRNPFVLPGNHKLAGFHQLLSIVMVICTFLTVGVATLVYRKIAEPENKWGMTETHNEFHNVSLDRRLDFIRYQLTNIIDDRQEAVMPVHHDTYRLVNTDLFSTDPQPVVLLNIR